MFPNLISKYFSAGQKQYLRQKWLALKLRAVRRFCSYTPDQLEDKLRSLGIDEGDTIVMHASFNLLNGFRGEASEVIACVLKVIGASGNLLMTSMAYTGSAYDYLRKGERFDVRKTLSRMGIITEVFRRRKGVLRSLNPVHPILAFGPKAAELVADHEKKAYSCGAGSPFDRVLALDAKVLFFDADFLTCTFQHYLEDRFRSDLPVKVYHDDVLAGVVIDSDGNAIRVETHVFNPGTVAERDKLWRILEGELIRKKLLALDKLGNTCLMLVKTRDLVDCTAQLVQRRFGAPWSRQ